MYYGNRTEWNPNKIGRPRSEESNSFNDEYDYRQNRMIRSPVSDRPFPNYFEPRSHSEMLFTCKLNSFSYDWLCTWPRFDRGLRQHGNGLLIKTETNSGNKLLNAT